MSAITRIQTVARGVLRIAPTGIAVMAALIVGFLVRAGLQRAEDAPPPGSPPAADSEHAEHTAAPDAAPETYWTCSMHPQIRRDGPGPCPLCGMDLVEVARTTRQGLREVKLTPEAVALLGIRTTPVERRTVEAEVRMIGKLGYDETRLAYLTAWVPGRLDRLYVDYRGIPVDEGDHLVFLYSPTLYVGQQTLLQALSRRAELDAAGTEALSRSGSKTVEAARERLRLWGLTDEQVREVEERGTPSDHLTIFAPMGGVVIEKHVEQGDYVQEGSRIYTIADLTHLWLQLEAYESDLSWLRYGQDVEFAVEAYPGESFHGTLAFFDPVLDSRTRTVKVRVNVENADLRLKPEMFAHAVVRARLAAGGRLIEPDLAGKWICPMHPEVVAEEPGGCRVCGMPLETPEELGFAAVPEDLPPPLVVPASAVLQTGTRAVVYVAVEGAEEPTFEGREILLGPRAGDHVLVRHGLAEGERVVTRGNFKLDSALQIEASPSMMSRGGGATGGGHDHAGAAPAAGADRGAAAELPEAVRFRIDELERAAAAVARSVEAGELAGLREAFAALGTAVDAVPGDALTGDAGLAWREAAMRLGVDAAEGALVESRANAERVLASARGTLEWMRARLGTTPPMPVEDSGGESLPEGELRDALAGLWLAYLDVHAALAGDDDAAAADAAARAGDALSKADPGDAADSRWQALVPDLAVAIDALRAAEDVEARRVAFEPFAAAVERVVEAFGTGSGTDAFRVHCPMAFGRGADWLQADEAVRNPYYGDAMLECGSVVGRVGAPGGGGR